MVATLTTHYSTFQNQSEQNSDPRRRNTMSAFETFSFAHSLSKLMNTCCFSMCVQTEKEGKYLDPSHSHTKATMTPSTTVTRNWIEMVGPRFLHKNGHAMGEKTACTLNITTKEKLSFGPSNINLKNCCHGVLLNKILYISKFPLVLSHAVPNCHLVKRSGYCRQQWTGLVMVMV